MINLLYIDLFCGAGGTSSGISTARLDGEECAKVIACVNHDANAIASHASNHPDAMHFTEDIRTLELSPLVAHLQKCRAENPEALVVLWASLECTNFSRAKGGMPRDADSRTLAEHIFRYIEEINPDYIQIENDEEFMAWGDMDENRRPLSKDKGRHYLRWIRNVKKYGYVFEYKILNAADFGAYTSRKRFFGVFAKKGLPIEWPEQTHCKKILKSTLFQEDLQQWKPLRDVLNLEIEGESIFNRKKPLSEKTLERIYAGLIKFVAGGKTAFLSKQYSGHPSSKNISLEGPAGTVTARDHHAFISVCYGNGYNQPTSSPAPTVTTKDKLSIVSVKYGSSIDKPCFTLIARMDKRPPYLIVTKYRDMAIRIFEDDSPMTVKIKGFMALYCIVDIKMRMLMIDELKRIMGFPEDYVLIGTQAEQNKFIGNAVEVTIAKKLCEALCSSIRDFDLTKYHSKQTA